MFKEIEIVISKLKDFKNPKVKLEQYSTPSIVIKEFLIFLENDLIGLLKKEKPKILDCCAGTGFLGIALILFYYFTEPNYLNKVEFVFLEKDKEAFEILKENIEKIKEEFKINPKVKLINEDFFEHKGSYDLIVMNPPFGIKGKVKDSKFLEKALKLSDFVVSFHTAKSLGFLEKNFNVIDYLIVKFPIKYQFWFHNKSKREIEVVIVKIKSFKEEG